MARQFGTRSFQPETISFRTSGNQASGLPWSAINRKIPVNILCAANNNPSTLEELSMELGISMPYMEEEVGLLENSELLKKQGSRYVTSFFIAPRECKNEVNELACSFAEKLYGEIWELAGKALEKSREYDVLNGTVSEMDAGLSLRSGSSTSFKRMCFRKEYSANLREKTAEAGDLWG